MRLAALVAVVGFASSGCLVHERPVEEDAASTPDAFAARDAAPPRVDAFRPDAWADDAYTPHWDDAPRLYPAPIDHFRYVDLAERACAAGGPTCVTFEQAGDGRVDTMSCTAYAGDPGETLRFDRCAADTMRTLVRVTTLENAEHAGIVISDGLTCVSAIAAPAIGESVELTGTESAAETFDTFTFYGIGARYRIEACAIGPCP